MVRKVDWPPLLAPGRHYLTLPEVYDLCVLPFAGRAKSVREARYFQFEQMIQDLLRAKICCNVYLDGRFLTLKPEPDDIDAIVVLDHDVADALNLEQECLIGEINSSHDYEKVDSLAVTAYPLGHEYSGCAHDARQMTEGYGIENEETYLKGYIVLRIWETDVGLRINR